MFLKHLKLMSPCEGIGMIGTATWLTSADVTMQLRADGTVRVTGLSNGWPEVIVQPAAVAWYVPELEELEPRLERDPEELEPELERPEWYQPPEPAAELEAAPAQLEPGVDRVVTYVRDPELEAERARESEVAAAIDRAAELEAAELAAAVQPRRGRGRPRKVQPPAASE